MPSWTLRDHGRDLAVHEDADHTVTLTIDGTEVGSRTLGTLDDAKFDLPGDGDPVEHVKVANGLKRLRAVTLVEQRDLSPVRVPFVPPPNTRARRLYELKESHPKLYAARHVVFTLVGFLGIGAAVSAILGRLLPAVDWSWLPDVDPPDIDPPDWLRYLNPFYWLRRITPDWDLGWFADLPWGIIVPLVVASGIAWGEYEKHRARKEREERTDDE